MFVIAIGCNIILTHFCVQESIREGEKGGDEAECRCCARLSNA